jgi:hypothetical protein
MFSNARCMQAMDAIEQDAANFLAFRGNSGCALHALYEQVHASGPFAPLPQLPETVKDMLWRKFTQDTDAYLLFCLDKQPDITADTPCILGATEPSSDEPVHDDQLDKTGRKKKGSSTKNEKQADGKKGKKDSEATKQVEVFLVTEKARGTLERVDAECRGVVVGLSRVLRLVALGIRAGCIDRSTGSVPDLTLV